MGKFQKLDNDVVEKIYEEKGLKLLGEYIDSKTQSLTKCVICNKEFYLTPRAVKAKTGYGCRGCERTKSSEQFYNEMKKLYPHIEFISDYKGSKIKIGCKCNIDGYEWYTKPNDLQQGHGCPACSGYKKYSNEEFLQMFYKVNNDIEICSEYVNARTPILCKCKKDGYEWYSRSYDLLHGRSGCKKCLGVNIPSTKEFKEDMSKIDDSIEILGEYINSKTPIECRCKICECIFYPSPSNLQNNKTGCPSCNGNDSKLEKNTEKILTKYNIKFLTQYKFSGLKGVGKKLLSYDFYLPNYNLLIECQGKQHKYPIEYFGGDKKFEIQQEHDKRKRDYAKLHKIKLLEIWYYDLDNIENILKEYLLEENVV